MKPAQTDPDYAPRAMPSAEVRAVKRLWDRAGVPALARPRVCLGLQWIMSVDGEGRLSVPQPTAYLLLGPDGPVSWSEFARLVAEGGDRG